MERKHNRVQGSQRQQLGATGERLAVERLQHEGYCILERNFRYRYSEIDIIARHEQDLVFVEVKTRRGQAYGLPEEAVTRQKVRRMLRAIAHYLISHAEQVDGCNWRIDVVAVQLSSSGHLDEIRIYQHAIIDVEDIY